MGTRFKKVRFHISNCPDSLIERICFKMSSVTTVHFNAVHFKKRVGIRDIPEFVLHRVKKFNYEENDIYIPNVEYIYKAMFEKFNTFDRDVISKTEEGKDFLVENKLCREKHGELENNYLFSYDVYIHDGKFCSVFEDYSTKY